MKLKHTTLYAKGWYEKTDNPFEDLKKILTLDNYTPYHNNDVIYILIKEYQKIKPNFDLVVFISGISPEKSEYNGLSKEKWNLYTSVVMYILSEFRFLSKDITGPLMPKYSKDFPKPKHFTTKQVIETFKTKKCVI